MSLYGNLMFENSNKVVTENLDLIEEQEEEALEEEYREMLQEGALFMSSDGKALKKEIKAKFKELQLPLKGNLGTGYNKKMVESVKKILKSKFKTIGISPIMIETVTDGYGVKVGENYYILAHGIYKDGFYQIKVYFNLRMASLSTFTELKFSKSVIPKDVIEYAIKVTDNTPCNLKIAKNSIIPQAITFNGGDAKNVKEKIVSHIESKYKDKFTVKTAMISNKITLKAI